MKCGLNKSLHFHQRFQEERTLRAQEEQTTLDEIQKDIDTSDQLAVINMNNRQGELDRFNRKLHDLKLLRAIDIRHGGVKFVSCPTCGRTEIDLIGIAKEVEEKLKNVNRDITVAIMGCVVNGPGEAREADIGIAGGVGEALLFEKGEIICKISENEIVEKLIKRIKEKYV